MKIFWLYPCMAYLDKWFITDYFDEMDHTDLRRYTSPCTVPDRPNLRATAIALRGSMIRYTRLTENCQTLRYVPSGRFKFETIPSLSEVTYSESPRAQHTWNHIQPRLDTFCCLTNCCNLDGTIRSRRFADEYNVSKGLIGQKLLFLKRFYQQMQHESPDDLWRKIVIFRQRQ